MARSERIGETGGGVARGGGSGSRGVTSSKLPSKLVDQLKSDIKARQAAKPATPKVSTGKAKANAAESKTYNQPVKGSGKPKYQNVVKPARVDTKAPRKAEIKGAVKNMTGRNVSNTEASRRASKSPNIAKQIDREVKETKGQRTVKPATPKVPVKKTGNK